MKYILVASLLSAAAYAAPFGAFGGFGQNQGGGRTGAQTGQTQQTTKQQTQPQQGQTGGQSSGTTTGSSPSQPSNDPGLGAPGSSGQTPTAGDLATAVSNWMADTSMVSNFLNTGASIQNDDDFKQAAFVAYNAEVDELVHKAIIDRANSAMPNVIGANSTLVTGGSFQDVVNKLQIMSQQGQSAINNIDLINQNRCVNVLPNIDEYMASTGSSSQAVRPKVCNQTGVQGGVQGTGPTKEGQPYGSPAAAFAAAKAKADGTGNGEVDNSQFQNGASSSGSTGTTGTSSTQGQQAAGQGSSGTAPTTSQQQGQSQAGSQQAGGSGKGQFSQDRKTGGF